MAQRWIEAKVKSVDPAEIPDDLVQGAVVLADLEARGTVGEVERRLQVRREGGYVGVDLFVVMLLFLAWQGEGGIKKFWEHARPFALALASLGGRKRLASSSSMSRGLSAVELGALRECASWLLTEAPELDEVLLHPSVLTYDAVGTGWHVFDYDPTVTTLRHRALPVGDDLPDPMRRSAETGAPGYSGRKRGDMQFRRSDLQHAGSGLWVHAHLHRGNGDGVADLELALADLMKLLNRLDLPREFALLRLDGEHGTVPYIATLQSFDLPFITRLNRDVLYDDPGVLDLLRNATFYEVPDSRCGPQRAAADLGVVTLHPGKDTLRPDGGRYEPVKVRVVACIFPRTSDAKRGRLIDGWQVELFAVDLPADRWPAPEAVASYYGRAGQENRLAQEDREVGLDRIASYHLPGQELATLIGLFWLNYQTARGFELERPPAVRPPAVLRHAVVDERVPEHWPRDPVLTRTLDELDWDMLLATWPAWCWDNEDSVLCCPDGRPLVLTTVRPSSKAPNSTGAIFCRPKYGCEACEVREACFRSVRPGAAKHAELSIPSELAQTLRERLALVRGKVHDPPGLDIAPVEGEPGLHAVLTPRFLPTEARKRFGEVFDRAQLRVEVDLPAPGPPGPRLIADSDADRQHRRQTWEERNARNRLPEAALVRIEAAGKQDLVAFLRPTRHERRRAVGGG